MSSQKRRRRVVCGGSSCLQARWQGQCRAQEQLLWTEWKCLCRYFYCLCTVLGLLVTPSESVWLNRQRLMVKNMCIATFASCYRFMPQNPTKSVWSVGSSRWLKRVVSHLCGGAMVSTYWKLLQKQPSSSWHMSRWEMKILFLFVLPVLSGGHICLKVCEWHSYSVSRKYSPSSDYL